MRKRSSYNATIYKRIQEKIAILHLEGRNIKSLSEEYNILKASVSNWVRNYREECYTNPEIKAEKDYIEENGKLEKQLEEVKKGKSFLKNKRKATYGGYLII